MNTSTSTSTSTSTTTVSKASLKQMNSFLRGEISAVETYEKTLEQHPDLAADLREPLNSHRTRVDDLRKHIAQYGGVPDNDSGAWGAFAKAVQTLASKISRKQAVSQLQDGEEHGTNDYERDYDDLDPVCREFVLNYLLPEQRKTQAYIEGVLQRLKM
jgi:hypothetical protein